MLFFAFFSVCPGIGLAIVRISRMIVEIVLCACACSMGLGRGVLDHLAGVSKYQGPFPDLPCCKLTEPHSLAGICLCYSSLLVIFCVFRGVHG